MIKWLGALVGFFVRGLSGAVLGFFAGSIIDGFFGNNKSSARTVFQDYTRPNVSPADFELNLLSLCSIVIKADGQVSQSEMDYVRQYFVGTYGKDKANTIFRTFNEVNKKREISAQDTCRFLVQRTRYEVRLQLLHFLFGIAQADGSISNPEIQKIREISGYLKVSLNEFESIKAMFIKSADNSYKILDVDKSATDAEIKKAYRVMAKKYHPDLVNTKDEAIKKGAEEKFKQVQAAYETIQKERGLN
ncbi:TerB family tellurite resistance protein [Maribacter sp. ACAM166]|uniref:TerB family tellurite resistance protein n=1 Tax=Maribacter sp. ACAM166 TaxID=2508996 RepID=UPI0010FCDB93|nr:TerB family tellurite resistance protein [Maribacter sp. ACAM166]TLP75870.1 molecular chaperone DjiA [Maribacter sp. ACAM166]